MNATQLESSRTDSARKQGSASALLLYLLLGVCFGFVLAASQAVSWFRIQEMFRFQSFHMYGIIGSAVITAAFSLFALKRLGVRALNGETIAVPSKQMGVHYIAGGVLFGIGWALTGACPGALFVLLPGAPVLIVSAVSAVAGAWLYGWLRPHLPH